mgnify:CR=1 FL=1
MGVSAGFFGKMPCKGDFVARGLPRALVDGFDKWFQQGMHLSRQQLGDQWGPRYGIAPIWRFFLGPGLFDEHAWLGVFIPSVDRVGRQFPCLIAVPVNQRVVTYEQVLAQDLLFQKIEDLLLDTLELDFDFDLFCQQVEGLALRPVNPPAELRAARDELPLQQNLFHMRYQYQHLDLLSAVGYPSLWMSEGTEGVEPQFRVTNGLPDAESFSVFVAGEPVSVQGV